MGQSVRWPILYGRLSLWDEEVAARTDATIRVLGRLPDEVKDALEGKTTSGIVWVFPDTRPRHGSALWNAIYLSPDLESTREEMVTALVVHELAHVYLNHEGTNNKAQGRRQERDAWRLVHEWGFVKEIRILQRFRPRKRRNGPAETRK